VPVFADSVFVLERGGKNGFSSEEGVVVVVRKKGQRGREKEAARLQIFASRMSSMSSIYAY
jgi:hypothetical protein